MKTRILVGLVLSAVIVSTWLATRSSPDNPLGTPVTTTTTTTMPATSTSESAGRSPSAVAPRAPTIRTVPRPVAALSPSTTTTARPVTEPPTTARPVTPTTTEAPTSTTVAPSYSCSVHVAPQEQPGSTQTVAVTSNAPGRSVVVDAFAEGTSYESPMGSGRTDASGSWSANYRVPSYPPGGTWSVQARISSPYGGPAVATCSTAYTS